MQQTRNRDLGSNKDNVGVTLQLLDLAPSKAIFITDRALAPLHAVGAAKVNWVLILYENCWVTDQHNGQKAASKGDADVGLDSWWAMEVKAWRNLWLAEVTLLRCGYWVKQATCETPRVTEREREREWSVERRQNVEKKEKGRRRRRRRRRIAVVFCFFRW